MATPTPPRGSFAVWQRLFRGYGPAAVLAVLFLLMSILVPSKATERIVTDSGSGSTDDGGSDDDSSGLPASGGVTDSTAGGAPGDTTGATTAGGKPAPANTAGVRACTNRPLQVPGDPYSPPCFTFSGSNGGVTSKGVTDKEIHVSFRVLNEKGFQQTLAELAGASLSDRPEDIRRTVSALAEFFNKRYQLYGRKIVIDYYNGVGSNTNELLGGGRDKAEADAETVSKRIGAFADMSATSEPYADALARRKVVGFGDPYLSTKWHDAHRPYIWSLAVDGTTVAKLAAEYSIKRLFEPGGKPKPADHAGGSLKGVPRKLATMAPENSWYQESVVVAKERLESAHVAVAENIKYQLDLGTMSNQAANLIPKLKSQGITTILCGCDPVMPVFLTGEMNRQSYFPEIIIVGTALTDTDIVGQLWNQNAAAHAFGVSSLQEPVPPTETVAYEAYKTVRDDEPAFSVDIIYYQMQMMAIGLHMAGPNLTPETFEKGMFAFPGRLGPAGFWELKPHDYTAADDVREVYWDPNATSKYNGKKGAYIDPQIGTRWLPGQIPSGEPNLPKS